MIGKGISGPDGVGSQISIPDTDTFSSQSQSITSSATFLGHANSLPAWKAESWNLVGKLSK
jgi:hypothetical protein